MTNEQLTMQEVFDAVSDKWQENPKLKMTHLCAMTGVDTIALIEDSARAAHVGAQFNLVKCADGYVCWFSDVRDTAIIDSKVLEGGQK